MIEEIIENENIKNDNNIEDPNIIAQRLLNIFRQLHIFSPEKKEAFNKMILSQPKAIKDAFGKLLGGAYLKEYIDTLENQEGYIKSSEKLDEAFDKTTEGYIQKQSKNINDSHNYNNINVEELIANITKNQTDLISDLTKIQTAQLAEIISISLQETYKSTTKSLVDALTSKNIDTNNIEKHIKEISANVDTDFKNNIEITKKKFEENKEPSKDISIINVDIKTAEVPKVIENKPEPKAKEVFVDTKNNKNLQKDEPKHFEKNRNEDKDKNKNLPKTSNQPKQNNKPDINVKNQDNFNSKKQPYNKFMEEIEIKNSDSLIDLSGISSTSFDNLLKNDKNDDDWLWLEEENTQKEQKTKSIPVQVVNNNSVPVVPTPIDSSKDDDDDDYIDLDDQEDFDLEEITQENQPINNTIPQKPSTLEPEEEIDDEDWEWDYEEEYDEPIKNSPNEDENDDDWEWEYEEIADETPNNIDNEAVTFEEKYLYPERTEENKPAPFASESLIEKEGLFKFDDFQEVTKKTESSNILDNPVVLPIITPRETKTQEEPISVPLSSKDLLKKLTTEKDFDNLSNLPENKIIKEKIQELDLNDLIVKKEDIKPNQSIEKTIDNFSIDKKVSQDIKIENNTKLPTEKRDVNIYFEDLEAIDDKNFTYSSSKQLLEIHKNKEKINKELEGVKIGLEVSSDDENIDNIYK